MKPEEAIEILGEVKELDDSIYAYSPAYMDAINIAISALKEIQQYRNIGTVEGCREAVEKQKPKKCDVTKDNFRIYYKCPTCNHCLRVEYNHGSWMGKKSKNCSKCGQAIQWDEN